MKDGHHTQCTQLGLIAGRWEMWTRRWDSIKSKVENIKLELVPHALRGIHICVRDISAPECMIRVAWPYVCTQINSPWCIRGDFWVHDLPSNVVQERGSKSCELRFVLTVLRLTTRSNNVRGREYDQRRNTAIIYLCSLFVRRKVYLENMSLALQAAETGVWFMDDWLTISQ